MKVLKKTLSAVLACLMIASLCTVFASAANTVTGTDLAANWKTMSLKYSSKTDKAIPKTVENEAFKFTQTEEGYIDVDIPTPKELAGVYPVAFLESENKTKLDNLTVTIDPSNFDFTADGVGMSRTLGVTFTTSKIEKLYDIDEFNISSGIFWGNAVYTNGLRHVLPEGKDSYGVAINVSGFYWAEKLDSKIASSVQVITFDGESTNEKFDHRPGFRWSFIARNYIDETPNGDQTGISRPNEKIYCGDGLTFAFVPDTTHGYIITINGKEYYDAKEVGYLPDQIARPDGANGHEKTFDEITAADDIYLLDFVDKEGYLGIGGIGNAGTINTNEDFTVKTINGVPAAMWAGGENTHEHNPGESYTAIESTCSSFGYELTRCEDCGAVINGKVTDQLSATGLHTFGDWTIISNPTYTEEGLRARECSVCHTVEEAAIPVKTNPFIDLPTDKWFSEACFFAYENGYMSGLSDTTFGPNNKLTRAQFVQILAKIAGADLDAIPYKDTFKDVAEGKWYAKAVLWAVDKNITGGIGNGMFGPDKYVTRQQLATFFMAYAKLVSIDTDGRADLSKYTDLGKVSSWAMAAMQWAVDEGIISGTSDTTLSPLGIATRAQVAVIFKAFIDANAN